MGKRGKNVRKQRAKQMQEAEEMTHAPHSIIYSLPGVGKFVRQLHHDLRHVFEPYTARNFVFHRNNRLKDVLAIGGRFHVSHAMYFTHTKPGQSSDSGSDVASLRSFSSLTSSSSDALKAQLAGAHVNFHIVKVPEGPRMTFRVLEYSLRSDIQNILATTMSLRGYTSHPPLVMCQGFTMPSLEPAQWSALSQDDQEIWKTKDRMLRLLAETLRGLVPALNVQKFKAENLKRILLISREEDPGVVGGDVIYWRHYRVTTQPKGVSRPLRKFLLAQTKGAGVGAGGLKHAPDLSHCKTIADYFNNPYGPDSEISDFDPTSDNEIDLGDIEVKQKKAVLPVISRILNADTGSVSGSLKSGSSAVTKHAVRLVELGPRMTIQLLKIEEGVDGGAVLYHRYIHRTTEERLAQDEKARVKREAKRKRKEEQQKNVAAKLKARKRAHSPSDASDSAEETHYKQDTSSKKHVRFQPPKAAVSNENDDDEEQ